MFRSPTYGPMISENLKIAISQRMALDEAASSNLEIPEPLNERIPTLKKGIYKKITPMLRERFKFCGRWLHATHGTWLSLSDMKSFWDSYIKDEFIRSIKHQAESLRDNWPNHVYGLFKDERLSIFAGSNLNNESIFLLWLDFEDEPELWVYDSNGESRYKNLNDYLAAYISAYISDDLSATQKTWRA